MVSTICTSKITQWALESISKRSGFTRAITGLTLLAYFALSLYVGVPLIISNALIIQMKSFEEVMDIAYRMNKLPNISHFKGLVWYFVTLANYYLFIETFAQYMSVFFNKYYVTQIITRNHRVIVCSLYIFGLIFFAITLEKDAIKQQFNLLFWTHFLVILLSIQSYLFIQHVYEGYIWLLVPFIQIMLNDTFAYFVGKNFGRTPLIALSPKKTIEGFVGGGLATIILGTIMSYIFCHFNYLVCPIKYAVVDSEIFTVTNCTPGDLFKPTPYPVANTGLNINYYPFLVHAIKMGVFVSVVAPFGGFFASGFKRAVDIKDFGNIIPGHGGFMDRFDCYFFMGTFMNVYISTFVKAHTVDDIFQNVMKLTNESQLKFYHLLKSSLSEND